MTQEAGKSKLSEIISKYCDNRFAMQFPFNWDMLYKMMEEYAQQREQPAPTPESKWPTEDQIEEAAKEIYILENPRKNMFHDNPTQYARIDAFKDGVQWLQTSAGTREAELENEVEKLKNANRELREHLSDMKGFFADDNSPL